MKLRRIHWKLRKKIPGSTVAVVTGFMGKKEIGTITHSYTGPYVPALGPLPQLRPFGLCIRLADAPSMDAAKKRIRKALQKHLDFAFENLWEPEKELSATKAAIRYTMQSPGSDRPQKTITKIMEDAKFECINSQKYVWAAFFRDILSGFSGGLAIPPKAEHHECPDIRWEVPSNPLWKDFQDAYLGAVKIGYIEYDGGDWRYAARANPLFAAYAGRGNTEAGAKQKISDLGKHIWDAIHGENP